MAEGNIETMQAKLVRLLEKQRATNAQASKLKKEMAQMDRKREVQYLCTLGRAWLALGEQSSEGTRATMQRFLDRWISRPTDIEILKGTPWAVTASTTETQPAYAAEVAYESGYTEQE